MAVVSESDLARAFADNNVTLEHEGVAGKCLTICALYGLSAADLADKWEAFVCNRPGGHVPELTVDSLEVLQAEIQSKTDRSQFKRAPGTALLSANTVFDASSIAMLLGEDDLDLERALRTPVKSAAPAAKTPGATPRPPVSAPPSADKRFAARTESGRVVDGFNEAVAPKVAGLARRTPLVIELLHEFRNFRYMYDKLGGKIDYLDARIDEIGARVLHAAGLAEPSSFVGARQDALVAIGRVCCDSEGKMNERSVMLEGSRLLCNGIRVPLDLSHLPGFSLFPGQIVAVAGANQTGEALTAGELYSDTYSSRAPMPYARTPAETLLSYHHDGGMIEDASTGQALDCDFMQGAPIAIFVAAGPYTTMDNLDFEPLDALLARVAAEQPEALVLLGPFLDDRHEGLTSGQLDDTFEELFARLISARIAAALGPESAIKVVMVPSLRDLAHDPVFPQPPFAHELGLPSEVLRVPNPAMLTINELVVGVCTNDVLKAMTSEEISRLPADAQPDRMRRIIAHLLQQRHFFPLFPPPPGSQVDFSQAARLEMRQVPDILLLHSDLHFFAKDVHGTLVVNPGRLAIGAVGGTFARITVHPFPRQYLPETDDLMAHRVPQRTNVEIVKV